MALAGREAGHAFRVFTLLSDGECNEGSTWESVMFASHHHLDNLTAIVDQNGLQAFGKTGDVLNLDPLSEKWRTFGWEVIEIDGHDFLQIAAAMSAIPLSQGKPTCVIARTVKGKGISFMENQLSWHYKSLNDDQLKEALSELERN
jgi:transketolase